MHHLAQFFFTFRNALLNYSYPIINCNSRCLIYLIFNVPLQEISSNLRTQKTSLLDNPVYMHICIQQKKSRKCNLTFSVKKRLVPIAKFPTIRPRDCFTSYLGNKQFAQTLYFGQSNSVGCAWIQFDPQPIQKLVIYFYLQFSKY